MRHLLSHAVLAIASTVVATPVVAQDTAWHVGVGIAGKLDGRGINSFRADADTASTLFSGITFDGGFGVEAAYVDLGEIVEPGIGGFRVDGELWSVGATYAVRFDAFEPYAKLGWFSRQEDGVLYIAPGSIALSLDDDGLMGEVGVRYRVTEPFALRVGYVHYDFENDGDGSAQFGAEWHF